MTTYLLDWPIMISSCSFFWEQMNVIFYTWNSSGTRRLYHSDSIQPIIMILHTLFKRCPRNSVMVWFIHLNLNYLNLVSVLWFFLQLVSLTNVANVLTARNSAQYRIGRANDNVVWWSLYSVKLGVTTKRLTLVIISSVYTALSTVLPS